MAFQELKAPDVTNCGIREYSKKDSPELIFNQLTDFISRGDDLRVIGGTARGTRLYGARGSKIRPVLDSIKESLFNILADRIEGAEVLDMFAGVGNLGIEALSRGCAHVDFIEKHHATAASLKSNLERAHVQERARVFVSRLPGGLSAVSGRYSLIFVDPPFRIDYRLLEELFRRIAEKSLLGEGGLLIYRYSPHSAFQPDMDVWNLVEKRDFGDSVVSILKMDS
ncbi:MAG: 16S rRNA (guanine(966)-N(2))-methyltransferase RsmD [Actinobacteria bacterium]|nr:16S rRNA (guanine(966)-N(2))-methyltransferase RsmD [Actinomycetota bacterium]